MKIMARITMMGEKSIPPKRGSLPPDTVEHRFRDGVQKPDDRIVGIRVDP